VKDGSGKIRAEGAIPATRLTWTIEMKTLPQPRTSVMEATAFTGWIYDHLQPQAATLKVEHPLMLRAIAAAKSREEFRQHDPTHAAVKTAQQAFADDIDRGGEDGAAKQPGLSDAL
jgi:hypothetical protein